MCPNKWVKCWAILMLSLTAINQNPPTASVVMYDCVLIATYTVKYCEEANKFAHYNSLVHTESYKHTSNKYTGCSLYWSHFEADAIKI